MNFTAPAYLLTLLAVAGIVAFALVIERRRSRYPVAYTNLELLAGLAPTRRRRRRLVPLGLVCLALACGAVALARPQANLNEPDQNATIVLLVDVSGSMRAADVAPTRLEAAVAAMSSFLGTLPAQFKVGLVAFSDNAQPLLSPTLDRALVEQSVQELEPEDGTALGDGLAAAVQMVRSSLRAGGYVRKGHSEVPAAIVLLSDGAQNEGILQPYQAAVLAKKAGIRVYGIAFGTPNGELTVGYGPFAEQIPVPPAPATVQMIAQVTGGRFYTAQTASSVAGIYSTLGSSIGRTRREVSIASWFAAAAAVLLLAGVILGRLTEPRLS